MKTLATAIALTSLATMFTATSASAQGYYAQPATVTGYEVGPGYYGGYGYGYGYGPATAAESIYRGYADLVRAGGEANLNNAQAQVQWENARAKSIVNHQKAVETYFHLRKTNEDMRLTAIANSRLSREQLATISKVSAPKRLGRQDWDAMNDGFAWPKALESDEYTAAKTRLDEIFRQRELSTAGLTKTEMDEARHLAKAMAEELKNNIHYMTPSDYTAAKKFLTSVTFEASQAPADERLAQK